MVLVLGAIAAAAAVPFAGAPVAPVVIDSYRVQVRSTADMTQVRTLRAPELFRIRFADPAFGLEVGRNGTEFIGRTSGQDGTILRNLFAAQPDGFAGGSDRYTALTGYVIAQARGGSLQLAETNFGGKAALRADVPLPANECAGLPARTVRIWLSARTLLPLRVVERVAGSGRLLNTVTYTYSLLNARLPAAVFAPPPLGRRPFVQSNGFRRTSPARAAGPLPYVPRLPTVLPPGFRLAVSGWAPRSGITGAEGSIPGQAWLFAAVYRRGQERIEITQRASRGDWLDDPFGAECQPLRTEPATIGAVRGTFGVGQNTGPHLYWRDGALLQTVSGPFPKDDLVAIAASLRKLGS